MTFRGGSRPEVHYKGKKTKVVGHGPGSATDDIEWQLLSSVAKNPKILPLTHFKKAS